MLSKISSLNIQSPFTINKGRAKIVNNDETLHRSLDDLAEEEKTVKDLILVIRRLPAWYYSILWHHSIHTKVNEKKGVFKFRVRDVYDAEFKQRNPTVLLIPEITCKTTYPDFKLREVGGKHLNHFTFQQVTWFKMETLAEDLLEYLQLKGIEVTGEQKKLILNVKENHSYKTRGPRLRYYSNADLEILYKNNSLWAGLEEKLYGNILQEIE